MESADRNLFQVSPGVKPCAPVVEVIESQEVGPTQEESQEVEPTQLAEAPPAELPSQTPAPQAPAPQAPAPPSESPAALRDAAMPSVGESAERENKDDIPLGFSPGSPPPSAAPTTPTTSGISSNKFDKFYHKNLGSNLISIYIYMIQLCALCRLGWSWVSFRVRRYCDPKNKKTITASKEVLNLYNTDRTLIPWHEVAEYL